MISPFAPVSLPLLNEMQKNSMKTDNQIHMHQSDEMEENRGVTPNQTGYGLRSLK